MYTYYDWSPKKYLMHVAEEYSGRDEKKKDINFPRKKCVITLHRI